jgi:hypothetical protein
MNTYSRPKLVNRESCEGLSLLEKTFTIQIGLLYSVSFLGEVQINFPNYESHSIVCTSLVQKRCSSLSITSLNQFRQVRVALLEKYE